MVYVFVDTNIWFRVVTQGKPGCEMEHFRDLKGLATKGNVELLYPEVVALEFEKMWTHFDPELKANTDKMERAFKESLGKGAWSEIEDIQNVMPSFLKEYREKKYKEASQRHKEVAAFLATPNTKKLDLHLDMWLRAKKRLMAGRVPPKRPDEKTEKRDRERDNDLCIIETLYVYFDNLGGKKDTAQLLFCSANTRDFVLEDDGKIIGLHPCHAKGLPPSQYFTDLKDMLNFIKKGSKVKEPSPQVIEEALKREASHSAKWLANERRVQARSRLRDVYQRVSELRLQVGLVDELIRIQQEVGEAYEREDQGVSKPEDILRKADALEAELDRFLREQTQTSEAIKKRETKK